MPLSLVELIDKCEYYLHAGRREALMAQWDMLRRRLNELVEERAELQRQIEVLEERLERSPGESAPSGDRLSEAFDVVRGSFSPSRLEKIIESAVATQPAQTLRVLAQMAEGELGSQPGRALEGIQVVIIEPFPSEYTEAASDDANRTDANSADNGSAGDEIEKSRPLAATA